MSEQLGVSGLGFSWGFRILEARAAIESLRR